MPLQDSDNFIVGRGTDSYKITYQDLKDDLNYVPPPVGTINKPTVLEPSQGAGGGGSRPIVTDTITAVDNTAGSYTCETDTIQSVTTVDEYDGWKSGVNGNYVNDISASDFSSADLTTINVFGRDKDGTTYCRGADENIGFEYTWSNPLTFDSPVDVFVQVGNDSTRSASINGGTLTEQDTTITSPIFNDGSACPFSADDGYGVIFTGVTTLSKVLSQWSGLTGGRTQFWGVYIDFKDGRGWVYLREGDGIFSGAVDGVTLELSGTKDLDCFEVGDVVQGAGTADEVKIVSIPDPQTDPPTIVVDGGNWYAPGDAPADQNQDKIWSANSSGSWQYPPTNIFDNDETTQGFPATDTTGIIKFELEVNNKLEFLGYKQEEFANCTWYFKTKDGNTYTFGPDLPYPFANKGWLDTASLLAPPFTITEIGTTNHLGGISLIRADDKILVDPTGETTVKGDTTNWDTTLTLADDTDLDVLRVGDTVSMGDAADVPYQPVSDSIATVTPNSPAAGQTTLTLSGPTDLAYFRPDDVVQANAGYYFSGDPFPEEQYTPDKFLNGVLNGAGNAMAHINGGFVEYTFPAKFKVTTGVRVSFWAPGSGTDRIYINGTAVYTVPNGPGDAWTGVWSTLITPDKWAGDFEKIKIGGGNQQHYYFGLEIDGEVLVIPGDPIEEGDYRINKIISIDESVPSITVDGGAWTGDDGSSTGDVNDRETTVTCLSPLKAPTNWNVERIDTDNNQLNVSHSTPDDNAQVWVANDNQAGTDFVVEGGTIIDDPLLTNEVDLRGSDFATTPPDSDTLKEIIWSINGIEYSAGTTNPWKPLSNLPTNSTVTVKVKYKGNTLEDSAFSDPVTFTTGNSIRSLFDRIAALESNDITDDATDTALLTLIAGLAARIQALEESN